MKEVLALIEQKKQEFAQLPLFEFMQDKSINPRQRLAFAPCLAPFAMNFKDLNKYVFREEPTNNKIQELINKHTYEDDHHWVWFLRDLKQLDFDQSLSFGNALRFLWGEETNKTRQVCNKLALLYTFQADPIQKLVIIEAIEATGNVAFLETKKVVHELQQITQKKYYYFGDCHFNSETGHAMGTANVEQFIENIKLTNETRKEAFELVEKVFEIFTELIDELLVYAKTHKISQLLEFFGSQPKAEFNVKPLGAYLLEAGLLNRYQLKVSLDKQKETPMRLGEILSSLGWVSQEKIEYMMDKVVIPERKALASQASQASQAMDIA